MTGRSGLGDWEKVIKLEENTAESSFFFPQYKWYR